MQLLHRIKAAFSDARWLQSSMRVLSGGNDSARQPFQYKAAVQANRSWIYAAASINAYAVASQPLRLYVRNRSNATKLWNTRKVSRKAFARLAGETEHSPSRFVMQKAAEFGDDFEVVRDTHPVLRLLDQVNPYQNGFEATVLRILYQELTGNAYIHPVVNERTGVPVELWTMPAQFVEIVPGKERFIDAYLYGASRDQRKIFTPEEVIHFKRPNPGDLYYGLGKLEAAWGVAMMNSAMKEMDLSFFENKARPDYLLSIKSLASQEEIDRLEVQIDEKLRGKGRTGRFLTATADISLQPLSFPPKDLGGREDIVEEIAAVFGVPVSMLKANDPNLASATVGFASWKALSVLPLLRLDEQMLNAQLLPMFGIEDDAFLAYDSPVTDDERFTFEKRRSSVAGGMLTVNEARMAEGLEPVNDPMADRLLMNGQPLGGVPPAPMMPAPMPAPMARAAQPLEKEYGYDDLDEKALTLEEIDLQPTEAMASNAERGLELREEYGRGGTAIGVARARDIQNRARLSPDTVGRMVSYFARHEVDKQGEGFNADEDGYPSAGLIAWLLWGGDSGKAWADSKWAAIQRARGDGKQAEIQKKNSALLLKDCGTGAGGFQPGNECGKEEGDGDGASKEPKERVKTDAGHDVEVSTSAEDLEEALQGNGLARDDYKEAAKKQTGEIIEQGSNERETLNVYESEYVTYLADTSTPAGVSQIETQDFLMGKFVQMYGASELEKVKSDFKAGNDNLEREFTDRANKGTLKDRAGNPVPADNLWDSKEYVEEVMKIREAESQGTKKVRVDSFNKARSAMESKIATSRLDCCVKLIRGLDLDPDKVEAMIKSGVVSHDKVNSWTTSKGTSDIFGSVKLVLRKPSVGFVNSQSMRAGSIADEYEVVRPQSSLKIVKVIRSGKPGNQKVVIEVEEDEDYK